MAKRSASVVGLNVGVKTIKAVELRPGKGGIQLVAMGIAPTPDDVMANGVIVQADVLGEAIKELLSENGFRSKHVVSSLAGQSSLVVRIIEVPRMEEKELAETMKYEVERHIPFSAEEVIMDFKPLGLEGDEETPNMEILLAVAQEDMVNAHIEMLEKAGMLPQALDIEPLAAARALISMSGEELGENEATAVIDIGDSVSDISVVRNGILTFTRSVPLAGQSLTQAIADALGLSAEEAERTKKEMASAVMAADEEPASVGGGIEGAVGDAVTEEEADPFASFDLTGGLEAGAESPTEPDDASTEQFFDLSLDAEGESTEETEPAAPAAAFDLSLEPEESPGGGGESESPVFDFSLDVEEESPSAASPSAAEEAPGMFDLELPAEEESTASEDTEDFSSPFALDDLEELSPGDAGEQSGGLVTEDDDMFLEPGADIDELGAAGEEVTSDAVFDAIGPVLTEMVTEIRRSLEYYTSRYPDVRIRRVLVHGGAAQLGGLDVFLSHELGMDVVLGNPFDLLDLSLVQDQPEDYLREIGPSMTVAVGLAARDMVGD